MSLDDYDFDLDFRFVELSYEMDALGRYLSMLENEVKILIKKEHVEAQHRIEAIKGDFDEAEWHRVHDELDELVEELIPRFFRNPFILMLWATCESGIKEISDYIQKKRSLALSINDIREEHFLKQASKYFEHVLHFSLFTDEQARQRFGILRVLRNAIAHSNGRLETIKSERDRNKIKGWAQQGLGISRVHGNIVFSESFLNDTYQVASRFLNDLVLRTKGIISQRRL